MLALFLTTFWAIYAAPEPILTPVEAMPNNYQPTTVTASVVPTQDIINGHKKRIKEGIRYLNQAGYTNYQIKQSLKLLANQMESLLKNHGEFDALKLKKHQNYLELLIAILTINTNKDYESKLNNCAQYLGTNFIYDENDDSLFEFFPSYYLTPLFENLQRLKREHANSQILKFLSFLFFIFILYFIADKTDPKIAMVSSPILASFIFFHLPSSQESD